MELLLNLVWIGLVIGSFLTLLRRPRQLRPRRTDWQRVLALACVLLLLFPVISASDDLHPSQALLEEATRRAPRLVSPVHPSTGASAAPMLPALMLLGLLLALCKLEPRVLPKSPLCSLAGHSLPPKGRAPPFRCMDCAIAA
jgi:hypothetical protein